MGAGCFFFPSGVDKEETRAVKTVENWSGLNWTGSYKYGVHCYRKTLKRGLGLEAGRKLGSRMELLELLYFVFCPQCNGCFASAVMKKIEWCESQPRNGLTVRHLRR